MRFAGLRILFQKGAAGRHQAGFSLNEMLAVIAILAILATIAVPNFISTLLENRVSTAARDVLSAFEYARLAAVKEDNDVSLNLTYDSEQISVVNAGGTTLRTIEMPSGVDLQDLGLGTPVRFNGRGQPNTYGVVAVVNSSDAEAYREIELMIGGNARIQE